MKLIRLAAIFLRPEPEDLKQPNAKFGKVNVNTLFSFRFPDRFGILVAAEIKLQDSLILDQDNKIFVPDQHRKETEFAIEYLANTLSIGKRVGRRVVSPPLNVAFEPESKEDHVYLAKATGLSHSFRSVLGIKFGDLPINTLSELLSDRLDGAALLAEALSHEHATGKLHEFIRLFERAFTLSSKKLIEPLSSFLINSNQGFTRDGVEKWILNLRHPATHADVRETFLLEADVNPAIARIVQGGYDVLLNKMTWRSPSIECRDAWKYPAYVLPSQDQIIAEEGRSFQVQLETYDGFFAYPMQLNLEIRNHLPEKWWVEPATKTD